jgi:hypothetical protein
MNRCLVQEKTKSHLHSHIHIYTLTHTPVDVSEVNQLVGVGALPQVAERDGCASDEVVA